MPLPSSETTAPLIGQDILGVLCPHSTQPGLKESKAHTGFRPRTSHGAQQGRKPEWVGDFRASLVGISLFGGEQTAQARVSQNNSRGQGLGPIPPWKF